jgi:hypothetical protein
MDESTDKQSFEDYIGNLEAEHATLVGCVAIAWNKLQNTYAKAFALVATPDDLSLGYVLWNSIKSDRTQRDTLAAVLEYRFKDNDESRIELNWAIQATDKLAYMRNATIHAPYTYLIDNGEVRMVPNDDNQNNFAKKLLHKDFKNECDDFIQDATSLLNFVKPLMSHVRGDRWADRNQPYPERPIFQSAVLQTKDKSTSGNKTRKQKRMLKKSFEI